MSTWTAIVAIFSGFGSIIAVFIAIWRVKKDLAKAADGYICSRVKVEIQPLIDISMSQVRYSIVRAHREYTRIGCIGLHDLEALEAMYAQYKDQHLNGFLTKVMKDIEELPVVSDGTHKMNREGM